MIGLDPPRMRTYYAHWKHSRVHNEPWEVRGYVNPSPTAKNQQRFLSIATAFLLPLKVSKGTRFIATFN